jgi:hypothetical protein
MNTVAPGLRADVDYGIPNSARFSVENLTVPEYAQCEDIY